MKIWNYSKCYWWIFFWFHIFPILFPVQASVSPYWVNFDLTSHCSCYTAVINSLLLFHSGCFQVFIDFWMLAAFPNTSFKRHLGVLTWCSWASSKFSQFSVTHIYLMTIICWNILHILVLFFIFRSGSFSSVATWRHRTN